jgi:signal peptidase I
MTRAIKITVSALIVALFAFSLFFVGIRAIGYATFVVTGGSMEPTIHKGSLVIDEPVSADKLKLGDVITFDHYDQMTTHRIVGVEGSAAGPMFSTKGDANQITDPEPISVPGRVGLVRIALPGIGYAVAWMQYVWRLGAMVLAALIFLACAAMVFLRKDKPVGAVARLSRPVLSPRLVPVRVTGGMTIEAQRIWAEHERWLQQAPRQAKITRVA